MGDLVKTSAKGSLPAKGGRKLPALKTKGFLPALDRLSRQISGGKPPAELPKAAFIYGAAASGLLVVAVYLLLIGVWGRSLMVLFPSVTFFGLALYYIRYPSS